MNLKCFRCGKEIDSPNNTNADYVIADDTIVREPRDTLFAIKHNQATLAKKTLMMKTKTVINPETSQEYERPEYPDLKIGDNEYDREEIPDFTASRNIPSEDLIKVVVEIREKDIQKTGIICPDCYKDTDFVIWGVHKEQG